MQWETCTTGVSGTKENLLKLIILQNHGNFPGSPDYYPRGIARGCHKLLQASKSLRNPPSKTVKKRNKPKTSLESPEKTAISESHYHLYRQNEGYPNRVFL